MTAMTSVEEIKAARKAHCCDWCGESIDVGQPYRWKYHTNRAGMPIVGRMYARLKLAGIEASARTPQAWVPDFSRIG